MPGLLDYYKAATNLQRGLLGQMAPGQGQLDAAALATAPVPGIGDAVGLAADASAIARDPSPSNIGFGLLGSLPLVPALGTLSRVAKKSVKQGGKVIETGKPVEIDFVHNTQSATDLFGIPTRDSRFGRFFEPSGRYVVQVDDAAATAKRNEEAGLKNLISGKVRFNNPLVIDNEGLAWKEKLSEAYGGLRGKDLSEALIKDGFDGVITVENGHTSEILDLTTFDPSKAKF